MAISDGLANRITVPLGVFGLRIDPVSAGDSGDYLCLVNNRRRPDAVVRLLVQGRPTPRQAGVGREDAAADGRDEEFLEGSDDGEEGIEVQISLGRQLLSQMMSNFLPPFLISSSH